MHTLPQIVFLFCLFFCSHFSPCAAFGDDREMALTQHALDPPGGGQADARARSHELVLAYGPEALVPAGGSDFREAKKHGFSAQTALSDAPAEDCGARSIPDWCGLKRDSFHILGYQIASVGILYALPESVSRWSEKNKRYGFGKWLDRTRKISWDRDSWLFDYVQHPYWGAGYYVRAKERGFDSRGSFLYAVTMSTLYEFLIEGQFERPSIQDLVATPVIGSLAGSYFMEVRSRIARNEEPKWFDRVLMVATDPFGSLNHLVDSVLGIREDDNMRCSVLLGRRSVRDSGAETARSSGKTGSSGLLVGLQFRVDW